MKKIGFIENGINIDHISHGNAWYVMQALNLFNSTTQTGVGLNLPSKKLGIKDLVKIEDRSLTNEEIQVISLFCVGATLSIIQDFKVVEKFTLQLPPLVDNTIVCPNTRCVSSQYRSKFTTAINRQQKVIVTCHYCEQAFLLADIKSYKFGV
ncbi:MAG: aspartate carbamoyltransferase regulatory subunit [Burkholderiales bacterium]|jgi:aspartate carbamoyltransferase regulatory subunit